MRLRPETVCILNVCCLFVNSYFTYVNYNNIWPLPSWCKRRFPYKFCFYHWSVGCIYLICDIKSFLSCFHTVCSVFFQITWKNYKNILFGIGFYELHFLLIESLCFKGFVPIVGAANDCSLQETGFPSGKGKELKEDIYFFFF